MGLNEWDFDVMIGHPVLTLESFGVTRLMILEIVRTFMPLRKVFAAARGLFKRVFLTTGRRNDILDSLR